MRDCPLANSLAKLGGSVYPTTVNTYNVRDQVTLIRQYAGAEGSGTFQDTTTTYDGYGRLSTRHIPEQNSGTATAYTYNTDDTVLSITDARGASATNTYNNRHLLTAISYSAPTGTESRRIWHVPHEFIHGSPMVTS